MNEGREGKEERKTNGRRLCGEEIRKQREERGSKGPRQRWKEMKKNE